MSDATIPTNPNVPPPPRRARGALILLAALLAGAALGGGAVLLAGGLRGGEAGDGHDHAAHAEKKQLYTCPMHPTIVQDHPGDCPLCGMKLVPMEQPQGAAGSGAAAGGGARTGAGEQKPQYQCPMHPSVVQDHPGDCPICGMKLVKVDGGGGAGAKGERKILFYRSPMDPKQTSPTPRKDEMGMDYLPVYSDEGGGAADVEGLATVSIDPSRQQLIGLRTAQVTRGTVGGAWRTVGRVAVDETRVKHVNVKIPVYVERIYVDFVGKPVKRGEPLFSVYSPDLLAAQEELLLALRTQGTLAGSRAVGGDALVEAARRKLQLWDVPPAEIRKLEETGKPTKTLTFYSPISGVVVKKDVVEGMKLDAGAMPYEIVDLSQVWVLADVYERELRNVKVGLPATLTLNAFPNHPFKGKVSFIDPLLDPKTRTVKVRLAFANPTGELRPEMFGEVVLQGKAREGLRVPADAVIDSGTQSVVFVALEEGKFQPRAVKLGASDGTSVEVVSGLHEGEKVVTRANFLIDSESRLRASLAALAPSGGAPAAPAAATPADAGKASGGADAGSGHAGHEGR
ncbi:efflux transporter, RND family, MFP subunit [Anaeromyxobacter sp. K]|uniref:efflux RND transporter periplasmic adaptor subunit n=1 Tax=Anaeromyxobacter sp. (strain K) TaxID=447217 RepID=UPI00015F9433|nr:efflux RND transporter periplasmic adaptor subunit [Anaeromyxobacter sp. K]ACG75436.1 efflux transporter, RND family, MFP subunit [Anaeromyxobacter sp. K]